jgi:hypothetical protein
VMSELALFVGAGATEGSADGGDDDWIACVHLLLLDCWETMRLLGDGCSCKWTDGSHGHISWLFSRVRQCWHFWREVSVLMGLCLKDIISTRADVWMTAPRATRPRTTRPPTGPHHKQPQRRIKEHTIIDELPNKKWWWESEMSQRFTSKYSRQWIDNNYYYESASPWTMNSKRSTVSCLCQQNFD